MHRARVTYAPALASSCKPLHGPAYAVAVAFACGLALCVVAYAALAYANAPLPAPTGAYKLGKLQHRITPHAIAFARPCAC